MAVPPAQGPSGAPGDPEGQTSARPSLRDRLQAIEQAHLPGNPVSEDEARRLGERPEREGDAHLPSATDLSMEQAVGNVLAGLPAEVVGHYHRTEEGWIDTRTGVVTAEIPTPEPIQHDG